MSSISATGELPPVPETGALRPPMEEAVQKTTQRELGEQLPMGVLQGGVLHRDFSFRTYSSRVERELDALRQANKGINGVMWAVLVLSKMLVSYGPYVDFSALSESERRQVLLNSWAQDVLYLLVCLRIQALGAEVRFALKCGSCDHEFRPTVDLGDLDVKVCRIPDVLTKVYQMKNPVEVGPRRYEFLVLDQPRWGSLALVKGRNLSAAEFTSVRSLIRFTLPDQFPVTDAILDEFSKYDFEHIRAAVDDDSYGADMLLEADCPECARTTKYGMDWSWDFFFKSPSL